jgi:2-iminobutanoate/2-iminopropanoate deaminase
VHEPALVRRADARDAATIARHRAAMFRDMGDLSADDFDVLCKASEDWLAPRLASGEYIGWLVEQSGVVVAGGGVLLREMWPVPGCCRAGRWAHVGNVYTEHSHRRRGLARSLMDAILLWCRANAIDHITLAASDEGRPLYELLGFEADGMAMKLPHSPGSTHGPATLCGRIADDPTGDYMRPTVSNDAPKAIGPYSQAVRANGFIFLAGQIALDPTTQEMITGSVELQTERVLRNISAILKTAGSSMENVVRCTVFLKSMNDFAVMNKIYATFFTGTLPARTAVEVSGLPRNCLIEIEATALENNLVSNAEIKA